MRRHRPGGPSKRRGAGLLLRVALLLASTAVSLAVGWWILREREPDGTVELVDVAEEQRALLMQRLGQGPSEGYEIPEADARRMFAPLEVGPERYVYDPACYFRRAPNLALKMRFAEHPAGSWTHHTGPEGFRGAAGVSPTQPDLRVLFTGDSHTEGVVPDDETASALLAELLRADRPGQSVEVLNAAVGGYTFQNYRGVLETNLDLHPDVFVVVVYGGNDFSDCIPTMLYLSGRPPPPASQEYRRSVRICGESRPKALGQALQQVLFFHHHSVYREVALRAALQSASATLDLALEAGVRLVYAYLPSPLELDPERLDEDLSAALASLELSDGDVEAALGPVDELVEGLRVLGIEVVDLRSLFRANAEPLYWETDHHLNDVGQRLLAEALHEVLTAAR